MGDRFRLRSIPMHTISIMLLFAATAMAVESSTMGSAVALSDAASEADALMPCTNSWYSWTWTWADSIWKKELSSGPFKTPTCASADNEAVAVPLIANQNALPTEPTTQAKPVEPAKKEQPDGLYTWFQNLQTVVLDTMNTPLHVADGMNKGVMVHVCLGANITAGIAYMSGATFWSALFFYSVVFCWLPIAAAIFLLSKTFPFELFNSCIVVVKGLRNRKQDESNNFTAEEHQNLCAMFLTFWIRRNQKLAISPENDALLFDSSGWLTNTARNVLLKLLIESGFQLDVPPELNPEYVWLANHKPIISLAEKARGNLSESLLYGIIEKARPVLQAAAAAQKRPVIKQEP